MSEILFLAHRAPFPPDRGDRIRSHHVLKALAAIAPVHVGCLADNAGDAAVAAGPLAALAASHRVVVRHRALHAAGLVALARREPVSVTAFRAQALHDWVARLLAQRPIETIYVFSGQMGQYVPPTWRGRLVMDLVDVDSAKFEAFAAARPAPLNWIDAREGRLLRRIEAQLVARSHRTLLVSEAEAALLRARVPAEYAGRIGALGNGIDARAFDPAAVAPHAELAGPGPHIVFTGQMDYAPNIAAARRAIERLMPRIRARWPDARFHVVGRAPAGELRALDGVNGARVWGEVADVRPFLAAAHLVLVPLELARGVQNKVLEAMAMACPVVLTPEAATGIPARDGKHFQVGASDDALASHVLALLDQPPQARALGEAARRLVVERMSWPAMLAKLPGLVGLAADEVSQRDAA